MNFTSKVFPVLTAFLVFFGMVGTEQRSVPTEFEIYGSNQKLAKEVKSILESCYKDLSYSLVESLTSAVTVYVADSEKDFKSGYW